MRRPKPVEVYRGSSKPHARYSYLPEGEFYVNRTRLHIRRAIEKTRRQQQLVQLADLVRSWGTLAWLWACNTARRLFAKMVGHAKYQEHTIATEATSLALREGTYPCLVRVYETQIKKERWPWPYTCYRANIHFTELPVPYPVPYQWVDGEITQLTVEAKTIEEALGQAVTYVLKQRKDFGGAAWLPKLIPAELRSLKRK